MKTSKLVVTALFSLVLAAPALVSADKSPPKREPPKKDAPKDSAPKEPKKDEAKKDEKKAPPPPAGGW